MGYQHHNHKLSIAFAAAILILTGCAPQIQKPVQVCPGKNSAAESLSLLRLRLENTAPLKANGQCLLRYYTEDNKPKKENFPVKLWVNPPVEIYLQGDVAFDPRGIVLGSNEDEFWLSIRLKEISSYWWGRWGEGNCFEELMISPKLLLEALGLAVVGGDGNWSLLNEDGFDVLTKRNDQGVIIKKMYIGACNYLIRRIEYFDDNGQATIVMELDKYKKALNDFFVPAFIKIINCTGGNEEDSAQITLGSIKSTNFTDKQRRRLFTRPQPRRFKHIYKIVDSNIIEQPQ